ALEDLVDFFGGERFGDGANEPESLSFDEHGGHLDEAFLFHAEDGDGGVEAEGGEGADGFDAIAAGHAEVAEDEVELDAGAGDSCEGFATVGGVGDLRDAHAAEDAAD